MQFGIANRYAMLCGSVHMKSSKLGIQIGNRIGLSAVLKRFSPELN